MVEELRIDVSKRTPEDLKRIADYDQMVFKFNTTMPHTPEFNELMKKIFEGKIGENSTVMAPIQGVDYHKVTIGKNVYVNTGCLFMASGGITIEDNTKLASNVQLISNNHDLDERYVITCLPVHIKKNCWIGAGATILRGVTIGENSVVGAGSVVTKDVEDNVIVAGNPAKIIRRIEKKN